MTARSAVWLLGVAVTVALWISAGPAALLYAFIFTAATVPGIPIGIAVFGSRHPAAWVGGALVGYGLTQLTLWAVIASGLASPWSFVVAWGVVSGVSVGLASRRRTASQLSVPEWSSRDVTALLLVLLLVPALMGVTYRNLGRADAAGNRYYRAYFTADFLWHSALAGELGKFSLPPRNPYLAPRAMNYYWTYFLLPSAVAATAPDALRPLQDVQRVLKANAVLVGLLMMAAFFVLVRSAVASPAPAAIAVALAVLAASAEGFYAIADLWLEGRPFASLLDTNVDAITNWEFFGLRVDNVPRSLWYTPQHTTSIALGLVALTIAVLGGAAASMSAVLFAGLALGLATTMNPLLGGVCSILYGVCVAADAFNRPRSVLLLVRHALAAVFVVGAVGWAAASRVMDGAGSALDVGFSGMSRQSPVLTLMLSLGPVLLPALAGLRPARTDLEKRAVVLAAAGVLAGLFLLYFVRVSEASWVGFRAGQILLVMIPVLLARTFEGMSARACGALALLILLIGLPTTVVDTWNAQDISNRRPGPGFRWTLWTTPDQQQAFEWIRENTAPDAVVQMEPIVRGREHWTLIPSFAARRMAAGLPISLLPIPEYQQKSERVQQLFQTPSAAEASSIARTLRLDYVYVDTDDLGAYPKGTAKFATQPELFQEVFRNHSVRIYRVL
jgi:hypothetical protein